MKWTIGLTLLLALPAAAQLAPLAAPNAEALSALRGKLGAQRETFLAQARERPLFVLISTTSGHFLVVEPGQLNKPFLLSATISRGLGERGLLSGSPADHFLFAFRRAGDRLQLVRLQDGYRAAPGTPEERGVRGSFPDVPVASAKIVFEEPQAGFVVVPAAELFLRELTDLKSRVARSYGLPPAGALAVSPEGTRLEAIAAFRSNLEIELAITYAPAVPVASETLPDPRFIPIAVRYSVSALPDAAGFETRPADPRVGYFTTAYRDFSDPALRDRRDPVAQVINRWRIEKREPDAPSSEALKPVVWWIDEAMPAQYRDAVRAGVLAWNAAFEAVGIRGALVVKEVDKDMSPEERARFDPADASYNMVRWFLGPGSSYAFGPSRVNPITGEIYNATVMLGEQMNRLWAADLPELLGGGAHAHGLACQVCDRRFDELDAAALGELRAAGLSAESKEKLKHQFLAHLVAHEIGHTLGLRHNFKASRLLGVDELGRDGLTASSVMDYTGVNVPAPGAPEVYYQTKVGPYDAFAIEYGYKPLSGTAEQRAQALKAVARRADRDRRLDYGTDEDASGVDPDVQRFDHSREPLRWAAQMAERGERLWRLAASAGSTPSGDLPPAADALQGGFRFHQQAVRSLLPLVGGVRSARRPADEGGSRFSPVPAAEQREVLSFLDRRVFSASALDVPPALASRAVPDPSGRWIGAGRPLPDVPAMTLGVQRAALEHLYAPATLRRLVAHEQIEPDSALPISELFERVRVSIWSELAPESAEARIAPVRRRLQREHLSTLAKLIQDPGAPADAVAQARADLDAIARAAARARAGAPDAAVKAHLQAVEDGARSALAPRPGFSTFTVRP